MVQGSGIGPTLFSIMISDLSTISDINKLFKYADDATLLAPENTDIDLAIDFEQIKLWAIDNKMTINMDKTKEIVFHRPSPKGFLKPLPIVGIAQVLESKLLGVIFNDVLKFDSHVKFIMGQCSQRSYLLRLLRNKGLSPDCLNIVFKSLIVSRLVHALPVWGGFLSIELIGQINAFLKRMHRYNFAKDKMLFDELLSNSDSRLFRKLSDPMHSTFQLLPSIKVNSGVKTRTRGHPFSLPKVSTNLHRNSFIVRCLFNYV